MSYKDEDIYVSTDDEQIARRIDNLDKMIRNLMIIAWVGACAIVFVCELLNLPPNRYSNFIYGGYALPAIIYILFRSKNRKFNVYRKATFRDMITAKPQLYKKAMGTRFARAVVDDVYGVKLIVVYTCILMLGTLGATALAGVING